MPVDVNRVDDIAAAVARIYREGETALLRTMTERLAAGLERSDWQASRMAALSTLRRAAGAVVTSLAFTGNTAVRRAVAAGYRSGSADAVRELAAALAPSLSRPAPAAGAAATRSALAVQALADATLGEIRPVHAAILPAVESTYRRAVTGAAARKLTGATTTRQAAQAAYATLVDRGITGYVDTSGRRWELTTYVEMATRTAVQRAAVYGLVDQFHAAGVRFVSVDDQPGECARCRPFEHQVLTLDGAANAGEQIVDNPRDGTPVAVHPVATLAEAMAAGLFHPHCRHTIRAYLPGISMLIKQGRTADPAGEAARERQREVERAIRLWRRRALTALTDDARTAAEAKVRAWTVEMDHHIRTNPTLTRKRYRETIGAGIIPPARHVDDQAALLGIPTQPDLFAAA